jgi:membrane protein
MSTNWGIIREAVSDWIEDEASVQGAALAFYSFLSLAPLVVISLAIAGFFRRTGRDRAIPGAGAVDGGKGRSGSQRACKGPRPAKAAT